MTYAFLGRRNLLWVGLGLWLTYVILFLIDLRRRGVRGRPLGAKVSGKLAFSVLAAVMLFLGITYVILAHMR